MRICFFVQPVNKGGLQTLHTLWAKELKSVNDVEKRVVTNKFPSNVKNFDAIHLFHTPFLTPLFFLRLFFFRFRSKTKVFITYYNLKKENPFRLLIKKLFLPLVADKLVLPSENMADFYEKLTGKKRVFVLHPLVEKSFFHIKKRNPKTYAYIGAFVEEKGVKTIIELNKKGINIEAYGYKTGDKFSGLIANELKKNIKVHTSPPEKALEKIKIAFLPYKSLETTVDIPLIVLECIASRTPLLTSNISPLSTLLPKDFLVNNWENLDEVRKKIKNIEKRYKEIKKHLSAMSANLAKERKEFVFKYSQLFKL